MSSIKVSLLVALFVAATVTPASAGSFTCGGWAPTETSCTTGSRTRIDILSHNVSADFNYVGTIESALIWAGSTRTFRCTYTQVSPRSCLSAGDFPPVGEIFTQRCRSVVPGTMGSGFNGVNGGVGTWQCSVTA